MKVLMSPLTGLPRGTWLGLWLKAVLALYVLAAAMMPLAHHDVVCHLKSPTHCTICVVGSSAEPSSDATALAQLHLNDAGAAPRVGSHVIPASLPGDLSGRAPPSIA